MFTRFFRVFAAGFLIIGLAAGCANTNTVKSAPLESGRSQTFPATYDRTNAATLTALQSMNISITSSNEDARGTTYLVSKSANLMSWGEVGRVIVGRSETDSTTVYVNWEKRSQMQITGTSEGEFSGQLFSQISVRL